MTGIYKITSPSGKVYIGQSKDIESRWYCHKKKSNKGFWHLQNSFNKYGSENHLFEVVHELPIDVEQSIINKYEHFYIQQHFDCGFKMLNMKGRYDALGSHSEETKIKISIKKTGSKISESAKLSHKGKHPMSEENKKKKSEMMKGAGNHFFGKSHPAELLKQIGEKLKGRVQSQEEKDKRAASLKGKTLGIKRTDETKRKISEVLKNRVHTEQSKKKRSEKMKGRKMPRESIERMVATRIANGSYKKRS